MHSAIILSSVATERLLIKNNSKTRGSPIPILAYTGLVLYSFQNPKDRNQTDSRRFKPNSCTVLLDEQSNPSNLLRLEDTTSRHRGHKQKRRFDRLIFIILLSLEYLLSV